MSQILTPSENKDLPIGKISAKVSPLESPFIQKQPEVTSKIEIIPNATSKIETMPETSPEKVEKPSDVLEENCVMLNGKKIEIKPTKFKYFRNKAASAYTLIKNMPIHQFLTYGKGQIDENRDADQLLYDFLVATFDDSALVRDNYDEMDAELLDRICKIFGRINHIDEKIEAAERKNREAQMKQH